MMNQVFVIFVIIGVASSLNLKRIQVDVNQIFGGSDPLTHLVNSEINAIASFVSELLGCFKPPDVSIRSNEQKLSAIPPVSSTDNLINISGIIYQLCITNQTQTIANIIDCAMKTIGNFRYNLVRPIDPILGTCLAALSRCYQNFIKNVKKYILNCDDFIDDFTSLIEIVIALLSGGSNPSLGFIFKILDAIRNFDCLKYLGL